MTPFGPVFRILSKPVLLRLVAILAAVEAIFLAEAFTSKLETVLSNDAELSSAFVLLLLESPRILDLSLAIGVLIALYFSVADARNRGELVILASTGVKWSRIVIFALILGLLGGAVSFGAAGYLTPLTRYAQRIKVAELRSAYITAKIENQGPVATQQTIRNTTFIATPPRDGTSRRGHLFVFQPDLNGNWRAAQARDWHVVEEDGTTGRQITLEALSAYEAPYPSPGGPPIHVSTFAVAEAHFDFSMEDVAPPPNLERSKAEKLLSIAPEDTPKIARTLARALMVPMAALLALVAVVAEGGGIGRFVALPVAAVVLLAGDVLARGIVTDAVASLHPAMAALLALALYLGPPLIFLIRRGEALMIPAGRRA